MIGLSERFLKECDIKRKERVSTDALAGGWAAALAPPGGNWYTGGPSFRGKQDCHGPTITA
ncbi:hypothetical protein GCM10023157_28790 [Gluconacetobacter asukensis]